MQRLLLIVDKQLMPSSDNGESSSIGSTCSIKSSDLVGQGSGMKDNTFKVVKIYYFEFEGNLPNALEGRCILFSKLFLSCIGLFCISRSFMAPSCSIQENCMFHLSIVQCSKTMMIMY